MDELSVFPPFSPSGRRYNVSAKRILDVLVSLLLIILLSPLMGMICLAIRLTDRGPVLFRQTRVGKDGKHFQCLKFRTMVTDSDAQLRSYLATSQEARREWAVNQKLKCDPRIIAIGHFLRTSSLDELPQLFNVLIGDMSLVGPRPIVPDETHRYGDRVHHYLAMRPGITGLWQVSGRSETTYEERVKMDTLYVQNWSFQRDLIILIMTIPAVIMRKGSC